MWGLSFFLVSIDFFGCNALMVSDLFVMIEKKSNLFGVR